MTPTQAKIIRTLTIYLKQHPDQRFFQAISNLMGVPYLCVTKDPTGIDTFHMTDEEVLERIKV